MKVYEIQSKPESGNLVLTERPQPQLAHGQVLLKMRSASLNYRDLQVLRRTYTAEQPFGIVPLSDGVGEIVALGEGVTKVKVGERVATLFMPEWQAGDLTREKANSALGGAANGILAEYVALPQDGVISVPPHLSDEEAATLPCAAVTAWHALMVGESLKAGETVLLQGTGGVSLFALQFAKMAGARIIITSSSDEKLDRARQLGAHEGINYIATPNWYKRVLELTDGRGVDHVVEVGGVGTLNHSMRAARYGGRITYIGVLTGNAGEVNVFSLIAKNIRLQGIYVGSRVMFEAMNSAIALHTLHPVVDRVFPFSEAHSAFAYMQSGQHFGKIVIRF
jgi:NADPH:quinone reductase-like Zn-dependent oxidoreductase